LEPSFAGIMFASSCTKSTGTSFQPHIHVGGFFLLAETVGIKIRVMVLKPTFNNISVTVNSFNFVGTNFRGLRKKAFCGIVKFVDCQLQKIKKRF
jgi:hypothetical protein